MHGISVGTFGLILICFFLPFVTVSCGNKRVTETTGVQELASFTGIQMVTGTTIKQPTFFGPVQEKRLSGEPLAICAFVAAIVGFLFSFMKSRTTAVILVLSGIIGVVSLLALKSKIDDQLLKEGVGSWLLTIDYQPAFYGALVLFVVSIAVNAYIAQRTRFSKDAAGVPKKNVCLACKTENPPGSHFCDQCGGQLG